MISLGLEAELKSELKRSRVKDQKCIDKTLLFLVYKVAFMRSYLMK